MLPSLQELCWFASLDLRVCDVYGWDFYDPYLSDWACWVHGLLGSADERVVVVG